MSFTYDPDTEILTLYGVKYSLGVFRTLGIAPVGTWVRIMRRQDGELTLMTTNGELNGRFDAMAGIEKEHEK